MEATLLMKSASRCGLLIVSPVLWFPYASNTSSHQLCCSFHFESLGKTKQILRNGLLRLPKGSNFFQLQKQLFGIPSTEQFHLHTIKSGETLTSISKKYGVSIYAIAAVNLGIKDVDFVLEGQQLKIPINVGLQGLCKYQIDRSHSLLYEQLIPKSQNLICAISSSFPSKIDIHKICKYQLDRSHSLFNEHLVPKSQKLIYTMTSSSPSKIIKGSGYGLLLAPVMALCIGCAIQLLRNSLAKRYKPHGANAGTESYKSRSARWKAVIYDSEFINNSDAEPPEKSSKSSEQPQFSREMPRGGYAQVESEYSKFLTDCGVSNYGYWRGGTTE